MRFLSSILLTLGGFSAVMGWGGGDPWLASLSLALLTGGVWTYRRSQIDNDRNQRG